MLLRTWIVYTEMVWLVLSSYNLDSLVPRLSKFRGGMCVESLGMRLQYGYMYIKMYTHDTLYIADLYIWTSKCNTVCVLSQHNLLYPGFR